MVVICPPNDDEVIKNLVETVHVCVCVCGGVYVCGWEGEGEGGYGWELTDSILVIA